MSQNALNRTQSNFISQPKLESMYHETVKKHEHTLAGNYNSCLTTIYGNSCRLQVLRDNVVSLSGAFKSFTARLQSMFCDMHVKHQHLQYVLDWVIWVWWWSASPWSKYLSQSLLAQEYVWGTKAKFKANLLSHVSNSLIHSNVFPRKI